MPGHLLIAARDKKQTCAKESLDSLCCQERHLARRAHDMVSMTLSAFDECHRMLPADRAGLQVSTRRPCGGVP